MLITMGIGFYSSRVVLEQLGVDAYGVYNVVGGIIVLVAFLNSAMTNATQRYINFEKGTGHTERLKDVFSASITIHSIIAIIIGIVAEIFGPWVLNDYLNIPKDLLVQANYVYQFSVISFLLSVITVPYTALVVANEKMSIFALSSIIESILKLLSAVLLFYIPSERLFYYALFILITTTLSRCVFIGYCLRNYPESGSVRFNFDKGLAKEMVSFSGWSVVGSLGYVLHTQGIAIVINLFFSSVVNAAQGIANQVNGLLQSFITNFIIALNPQIVQTYAAGELQEMHKLIYSGCRLSLFLAAASVIPIMVCSKELLSIWLTIVPDYTIGFVTIVLVITLINSITNILSTAQNATGNIKRYQLVLTSIGLLHIPFTVIAFLFHGSPLWAMYIYLVITIILQICRIGFVCKSISLNKAYFYNSVILKSLVSILISLAVSFIIKELSPRSLLFTVLCVVNAFICVIISFLFITFNKSERQLVYNFIKSKF